MKPTTASPNWTSRNRREVEAILANDASRSKRPERFRRLLPRNCWFFATGVVICAAERFSRKAPLEAGRWSGCHQGGGWGMSNGRRQPPTACLSASRGLCLAGRASRKQNHYRFSCLSEFSDHVTSKGQVAVPQAIRKAAGLLPDTEVDIVHENVQVILRPASMMREWRSQRRSRMRVRCR